MCLFKRLSKRRRENLPLLVHSPNDPNSPYGQGPSHRQQEYKHYDFSRLINRWSAQEVEQLGFQPALMLEPGILSSHQTQMKHLKITSALPMEYFRAFSVVQRVKLPPETPAPHQSAGSSTGYSAPNPASC